MSANDSPSETGDAFRAIDACLTPLRVGVGLALALAALFPDIVVGTGSFYFKDYGVLGYPVIQHHHDRFWSGDLIPFWNAHSNCGAPFMAQWGTMTLYPFSLFHLLLPLPWSLGMFCLIHLWFGGMGMFRLAATRHGPGIAAALAATVFVFNGFTLSCLQWPNYTVALGWLPWVALAVDQACKSGGRAIVAAALAGTMQMLSGVPEFIILSWLAIITLLAVNAFQLQDTAGRARVFGRCASVILLIAGLSAVQLLPFFELLSLSQRHSHFTSEKWAIPWHGVANFFVPLFHYAKTYTGDFFQQGQSLLASYYTGLAAMSLAIWGSFRAKTPHTRALAAIAGVSVLLAMGENGFLYLGLKKLAPRLGFARYPVKFLALLAFTLPLLAAQGLVWFRARSSSAGTDRLRRNLALWCCGIAAISVMVYGFMRAYPSNFDQPTETLKNAIWRIGFLALFLLVLFLARQARGIREQLRFHLVALAIMVIDIATHLPHWNPRIDANEFTTGIARQAHEFGPETLQPGVSRAMISPAAERIFLFSSITNAAMDFQGKRLAFWSNLNLLDNVPKLNGSSTLQLEEQAEIQNLIYGTNRFDATGLADFLAVSHETSATIATQWQRRKSPSPWIAAGRTAKIVSPDQSLSMIASGETDLKTEVLITAGEESLQPETSDAPAMIDIRRYRSDSIEFHTNAKQPTLVVIAQSFHPGWIAEVNGARQTILRANHAFQAIPVPAGPTKVTMRFRERSFLMGLISTLLTAALCGWLWRRGATTAMAEPMSD